MDEPDVMTELWSIKDRLSQQARRDIESYCKKISDRAREKGFTLLSSIPSRIETGGYRAVAEPHTAKYLA